MSFPRRQARLRGFRSGRAGRRHVAGYETLITPGLGAELLVIVFIVVIIGGPGSIQGTLLGALLVGLSDNYVGFLAPKLALASTMILILLWRLSGLAPAVK